MPAIHVHPVSKNKFSITKIVNNSARSLRALSAPVEGNVHIPSGLSEPPMPKRGVHIASLKIFQSCGVLYISTSQNFELTRERANKLIDHLEYLEKYSRVGPSSAQILHDSFVLLPTERFLVMHLCVKKAIPLFRDDIKYLIDFLECAYLSF